MRLGVLADDLTGAFDTGVQFRNWGLSVEVLIGEIVDPSKITSDVIVIDTESRLLSRGEAYQRVFNSTKKLMQLDVEKVYKKIDSTLRGNIGIELEAVMEASKSNFAIFAPAYPTYGRTTLSGNQFVNNTPVDRTEYADELVAETSDISAIIGAQSNRRVGLVTFDTVEAGVDAIKSKLNALKKIGIEVAVFDALTEKHLTDIAYSIGDTRLLVGSAGLASEVPPGIGIRNPMPILSICGSTRRISRLQTSNLHDRLGFKEVQIVTIKLIEGKTGMKKEVKRCVNEALGALNTGVDVSLISSPNESSPEEYIEYAEEHSIKENEAKILIEKAMGEIAYAILSEVKVVGLILTGGATSLRVCEKLGASRASIVEEIEPGIPLLVLSTGTPAVTKAGGFGVENSLIQATQRMRRMISK